ncbi:MAG: DUF481 domain-containing protein [Candidatus Tectomicrobia bacterium]|uniref:DUF481 domain-containing protein n=1 Tax=Tectimicrobiota bacterium TaxID=2528274 RepID=A0A932HW59_UNCTE|nr:DUF481 domain-containing protein [Candidatus Tectomicrobia bacterium]
MPFPRFTMRAHILALCLALLAALAAAGPARAAEPGTPARIYLKNGDLLTGRIIDIDSKAVVVETKHLGKVWVAREGIDRFEPPLPSRAILKTGEELEGEVVGVTPDSVTFRQGEVSRKIANEALWRVRVRGVEAPLLTGSLGGGLSMKQGNSDSLGYNMRGRLIRETYRSEFRLKGAYLFEELDGKATADKSEGDLHFSHFFARPWYSFFRERLENDQIADISLHSETSAGLGYRIIDFGETRLDLESGPGFQLTRFQGGRRDEQLNVRAGTFFRTMFPRGIRLEASAEYIQGLEAGDDFIARAEVALRVPLRANLSFVFSGQDRFDNTPAPGSERNDFTLLSNLELTF